MADQPTPEQHCEEAPAHHSEEEEEDDYLDVDDGHEVVAEDKDAPPPPDYSSGDDGEANNDDGGDDDEEERGEAPKEKVPERDDSLATFTSAKPLHVISAQPKSNVVACGGEEDKVFVLRRDESNALQCIHTLTSHTDTVTHVSFSPNGEILATAGMDCHVFLWDAMKDFAPLHKLSDLSGEIETLLWHPSSLVLVAGASDAQAAMWNALKGNVVQFFGGHRGAVTGALWACENKKLLTASTDGSVICFNPKTAEAEVTIAKDLSPHGSGITAAVATSIAGDVVAVGCEDGTLHLISLAKGKTVHHFPEVHTQSIESVTVCEMQPLMATCSCDCILAIWSLQDYSLRSKIDAGEGLTKAVWLKSWIVVAGMDGDVRVWEGRGGSDPVARFAGHSRMVLDLVVRAADRTVVTASDDGSVRTYPLPPEQH